MNSISRNISKLKQFSIQDNPNFKSQLGLNISIYQLNFQECFRENHYNNQLEQFKNQIINK